MIIVIAVGIYFVRREWKRYAENNPLYIVPTAYDFPYKDNHHNKRIQFDGFSLLVPDDFYRINIKSRSKWYKSSYSAFIADGKCVNTSKSILEGLNIHYDSEYEAELYMLMRTPDDCISINPRTIMRNCTLKTIKTIVLISDLEKINYRDFGTYSVIAEQGRRISSCTIFRGRNRYAHIAYFSKLGSFDQNTINQILSTVKFD